MSVVVRGGVIASRSHNGPFDVHVQDGKIVQVLSPGSPAEGAETLDASGLVIFPGLVDAHVHFRDPGDEHRETFMTGSAAAAAGGVTTVLEMPTSDPTVTDASILINRRERLRSRSIVDFALFGGAGTYSAGQIDEQARAGAIGFKTFLHGPPAGRDDSIGRICALGDPALLEVIELVASTGLVHALHCEDEDLLRRFADGSSDLSAFGERHADARPIVAEDLAVARASVLGRSRAARLHFVHVSSPASVDLIVRMRATGLDATVETCPHYVALNEDTLIEYGSFAKCNPPLRSEAIRQDLLGRLQAGEIDIIASDHCPYTVDELLGAADDPINAPAGLPGIEFMLPTMLTLASQGSISLHDIAMTTSFNPAHRYGLKNKGDVAVGYSADLAMVDPAAEWSYGDRQHYSLGSAAGTYLTDMKFVGRVERTMLRGQLVYDRGEILQQPGYGRWIPGAAHVASP